MKISHHDLFFAAVISLALSGAFFLSALRRLLDAWNVSLLALVVVVSCAGGCASGFVIDYVPRQDEAIARLAALYGIKADAVPPIEWVRQYRLDCDGGRSWEYSAEGIQLRFASHVGCVSGTTRQ